MDHLFEALTELSVDPLMLDDFLSDPDNLGARLSPEAQAALARWREAPGGGAHEGLSWARCATCSDPGPDWLPDPDPAFDDGEDEPAEE